MQVGRDWLVFHSRLILPMPDPLPYGHKIRKYREYLLIQAGLEPRTVDTHTRRLTHFFQWLTRRRKQLRWLTLLVLEEYFAHCGTLGWKQTTIAASSHVLKSFLRFSERRRWSPQKISWGII